MNQDQINQEYKKFNIPDDLVPQYTDPYEFAKGFKKCSILKDSNNIGYSNTSSITTNKEKSK